jgi:hypothetical protein
MRFLSLRLGVVLSCTLALPALAQAPYPPAPPPGAPPAPMGYPAVAAPPAPPCLCLKQSVDASNADMAAKSAALAGARAQLDQLDQQLGAARSQMNVDNPQSVAQFRQLLQQRDAAANRAGGGALTESQAATARYNAAVGAYNNQCAGRPLPPPPPGPVACPPMP